jgi:hypothetical protein
LFRTMKDGRPKLTRRMIIGAATVATTVIAPLAFSAGSTAFADVQTTTAPITVTATTSAQSAVPPSGPLTRLVQGTAVAIHAEGPAVGELFAAEVRLCRAGLNITDAAEMLPSAGDCLSGPLTGGGDFDKSGVASPNRFVDLTFNVGTGTRAGSTIQCDSTHPCALWMDASVPTSHTADGSGHAFFHYDLLYAGQPAPPNLVVSQVAGSDAQLTVHVDDAAAGGVAPGDGNAPISGYDITITGAGTPVPASPVHLAAPGSQTFTGLVDFTLYNVTATRSNTPISGPAFTSNPAAASGTPVPPAVAITQIVSGDHKADVTVNTQGTSPASYNVEITPVNPAGALYTYSTPTAANPFTVGSGTPAGNVALTNGTLYSIRVQAVYPAGSGSFSAPVQFTPNGTLITQTITVRRPQGALILTQVCGAKGAVTTGTAPAYTAAGVRTTQYLPPVVGQSAPIVQGTLNPATDPLFGQYPYPVDANNEPIANYPTDCAINLGTAKLITNGAGAGQYFTAAGDLNQVTVVDTRDTDPGWIVNGKVSNFTSPTGSFSGSQLGWAPAATSKTASFTDAAGHTYAQATAAGSLVAPSTPSGLGSGKELGHGNAKSGPVPAADDPPGSRTGGLGIARFDAPLTLWIPIFAMTGNYTATLELTAI